MEPWKLLKKILLDFHIIEKEKANSLFSLFEPTIQSQKVDEKLLYEVPKDDPELNRVLNEIKNLKGNVN
jgi:hypothetical protein